MRITAVLSVILVAVLGAPGLAWSQEPVRDFSQLSTRLRPGDTIWVTDAQGREVRGEIGALEAGAITFRGQPGRTFAASDVRQVVMRQGDSLRNGALIGLGIGAGSSLALCLAAIEESDEAGWCALATVFYGGVGAGIGVGIDALIPGKKLLVYRVPGAGGRSAARLSIAPLVTTRAKGVAVSFAF